MKYANGTLAAVVVFAGALPRMLALLRQDKCVCEAVLAGELQLLQECTASPQNKPEHRNSLASSCPGAAISRIMTSHLQEISALASNLKELPRV